MQFCLDSEKTWKRRKEEGKRKMRKKPDTRALTIILMYYAQKPEDCYLPCHGA